MRDLWCAHFEDEMSRGKSYKRQNSIERAKLSR